MAVEDELMIRNLVSTLALQADGDDIESYMALFTEDAEWIISLPSANARVTGHAAIRAAALQRRADGVQGAGSHTRHAVTTLSVHVDGNRASTQCYLLVIKDANATPIVSGMVVYNDEFRKTEAGWKLAVRRISAG